MTISGATNDTFEITSVGPASAGQYAATVSNAAGSVTSSVDLQNWTSVTAAPVTGTIDVQNTQASTAELRFYRVLME